MFPTMTGNAICKIIVSQPARCIIGNCCIPILRTRRELQWERKERERPEVYAYATLSEEKLRKNGEEIQRNFAEQKLQSLLAGTSSGALVVTGTRFIALKRVRDPLLRSHRTELAQIRRLPLPFGKWTRRQSLQRRNCRRFRDTAHASNIKMQFSSIYSIGNDFQ